MPSLTVFEIRVIFRCTSRLTFLLLNSRGLAD